MRVSVIMPVFNAASSLITAIESTGAKEGDDVEIIVVDDGSTDGTREVAEQLQQAQENIHYFHQENSGPGAARNRGMKEAKGEYIAFLDADDEFLKNSIEERAGFLDQNKDLDMVFTDYYVMRQLNDTIGGESRLEKNAFLDILNPIGEDMYKADIDLYKYYLSYTPNPIWTCTVMMRRSLIDKIGEFRTDIYISEDRDYWMRILKKASVGYIHKPLAVYKNFQSDLTKRKERAYLDTIIALEGFLSDELIPKVLVKRELAKIYYNFGHYYVDEGEWINSRKSFFKSILNHPCSFKYWIYFILPSKNMTTFFQKQNTKAEGASK